MIKKILVLLTAIMLLPLGMIQLASGQDTCPCPADPTMMTCPCDISGDLPPAEFDCGNGCYSCGQSCDCCTVVDNSYDCGGGCWSTPTGDCSACNTVQEYDCGNGCWSSGGSCQYCTGTTVQEFDCGNGCWSSGGSCQYCTGTTTGGTCGMCSDGYYPTYPACDCAGHTSAAGCQCSCGWSATCSCSSMCPAGGGISCPCGWKYDDTKDCTTFCAGSPIASTIPGYVPPGGVQCTAPEWNCGGYCSTGGTCGTPPLSTGTGCQCSCGYSPNCNCASMCPTGGGCQCSCGWSSDCNCASMCPSGAGSCPKGEYRCGDGSCSINNKCGCFCSNGKWSADCMCGTSGSAAACPPGEWRCGDGSCSVYGMCSSAGSSDGCPGCDQYGPGFQCGGRWVPSCGGPSGGMNCGDCPPCDHANIGYDCHGCWVPACGGASGAGGAGCGPCKECRWPDMWGRCPESMTTAPIMTQPPAGGAGCQCYDNSWRDDCRTCPVPPPGWVPPTDYKPAMPMMTYDKYGRPMQYGPDMAQMPMQQGPQYCPPADVIKEKTDRCREGKGKPIERLDPMGCPFIECDFSGMAQAGVGFLKTQTIAKCPSQEEMSQVKAKCTDLGLKAVIETMGQCSFVKCADMGIAEKRCPEPMAPGPVREACEAEGKVIVDKINEQGCKVQECVTKTEAKEFACMAEETIEPAKIKCEESGGKPLVRINSKGCAQFDCLMRGDERDIEFEEITELPPAAKILGAVLKLEQLKIQFDGLSKEIGELAAYYDKEGNTKEAEKFHRAAAMVDASKEKINGLEAELKLRVQDLTIEDVMKVKKDIKYITKVIFNDILFVILGGEELEEASQEVVVTEGVVDCGRDGMCFEKQFRVCKPAKFMPPEEQYPPTVEIGGVGTNDAGEKVCLMYVKHDMGGSMKCAIPDFAFARMDPNSILPYCEGDMADFMKKSEQKRKGIDDVGMMGCAAVERGKTPRGVCGNGCCEEQHGESFETCGTPRGDCMPAGEFEFDFCPGAEIGIAECESKGGRPYTEPNEDGTCELFDRCIFANDMMQGQMPMMAQMQMMEQGMPMEYKAAAGKYKEGCASVTPATKGLCGNGCCEPNIAGENHENCPDDCMEFSGETVVAPPPTVDYTVQDTQPTTGEVI